MRGHRSFVVLTFCAAFGTQWTLAQTGGPSAADAVRGGWVAEVDGRRHIYVLKVRDTAITGIYCVDDCSQPRNLTFVQKGTLKGRELSFEVAHDAGSDEAYRTYVTGRLADGVLELTTVRRSEPDAKPVTMRLRRDSRKPLPVAAPAGQAGRGGAAAGPAPAAQGGRGAAPAGPAGGRGRGYVPPGPNELLTAARLSGLWVGGNGPNRQHFIFRQVGNQILGLVCGPCDNPYTFGPLDNGVIKGDTLTFDIVHEDWGIGIENGPFVNQATATVSRNEMYMQTVQDNGPGGIVRGQMILTGPLRLDSK